MSLRQKTIVIIGLTFVGLMALLYTISRSIVLVSFAQLEEKNTAQNVTRATNAILDELVELNSTAVDWASWDDTYAFIADANEQYIANNLPASTLFNLRLNLMLFMDASGRMVFGKAVDLANGQEIPIPQSLLAQLSPNNPLLQHPDLKNSVSGIILLPEVPALVVSRPILTSAGAGPSRGTLLIGRYLDANEVKRLAELAHLSFQLRRVDDPQLPADFQAARPALSAEAPIFIQPLDAQTVAGYTVLTDIYQQPVLMVRVDMPREIYQQGQVSISYLMWSLMAASLVFAAVTVLLLEKQVLSRLTRLSQSVSQIGASGDLSARAPVTGRDELSSLAEAINTMLSSLAQSELALREQTRRNELILHTSMDGFMVMDMNGRLREVNPAFCRIVGYSPAELLRLGLKELEVQESSTGTVQKHIETILETGADRFETKYRRQDGQLVDVEVSINFVEFGQDRFCFGFVRDITERKRVETEISRRNRELVLLNQIIAASATSLEAEVILETACRELAQTFDIPRVTAILFDGQSKVAQITAEYLAEGQVIAPYSTIPVAGNFLFQQLLAHRAPLFVADARTDPHLETVRDLINQHGLISFLILPLVVEERVIGCLNLATTERRHFRADEINLAWSVADQVAATLARARLIQTQQRLSAAIEQAAESIIITDTAGTIIYVNPAFERISGYSRAEVIGQSPRILQSGQLSEDFYRQLWATISAGQVWRGRLIDKGKDGTSYTLDTTITPVRDERGAIVNYVAVGDDVTDKLHLEEQLRQAQKMEAIGRLAGGVAHDFNNLLTVITGYSELLLHRHPDLSNSIRQEIEQIKQAGERAAKLTGQLLAFSRKQPLQPQILDLNDLVANMEKMLHRLIGEDIDLVASLAPDLGQVKADPGQIEQVLANLAVNARDAMPNGGKLTIETANISLDRDYAHQHVEVTPGEYVMIAVSDTGIGIPAEVKAHLFEPFFTTKEPGKGTGLGLATCFGIVKQNGGHISVYSEPGQGATFKVYLPRIQGVTKSVVERAGLEHLPGGTEAILLVEDESGVRDLAARVLRQQGYTVLEAANGANALDLLKAQPGAPIQLLVTDVIMPHMGGQVLVERLKGERPDLRVLFVSGYTDNAITRHGILERGIAFLQKPFTPDSLLRKVREVLDTPPKLA